MNPSSQIPCSYTLGAFYYKGVSGYSIISIVCIKIGLYNIESSNQNYSLYQICIKKYYRSIPMSRMSGCSGHLKSSRRPVNVLVGLKKDILNSSSLSLLITFPTTQSLSYSTATKSSSDKSCGVTFLFSEFCLIVLDFVGAFSLQCKLNYHSEYIHCIVDCNPSRWRRIFSYIFFPY